MTVVETRVAERIDATCGVCKQQVSVPDKGIGRAVLAAWRTQHQHREETP